MRTQHLSMGDFLTFCAEQRYALLDAGLSNVCDTVDAAREGRLYCDTREDGSLRWHETDSAAHEPPFEDATRVTTVAPTSEETREPGRVAQIRAAFALARAHSHAWASDEVSALLEWWRTEGIPAEWRRQIACVSSVARGDFVGIDAPYVAPNGDIVHTTGTGRMSWTITALSGIARVRVEVTRAIGSAFAEAIRASQSDEARESLLVSLAGVRGDHFRVFVVEVDREVNGASRLVLFEGPQYVEPARDIRVGHGERHHEALYGALRGLGVADVVSMLETFDAPQSLVAHCAARVADEAACIRLADALEASGVSERMEDEPSTQVTVQSVTNGSALLRFDRWARAENGGVEWDYGGHAEIAVSAEKALALVPAKVTGDEGVRAFWEALQGAVNAA